MLLLSAGAVALPEIDGMIESGEYANYKAVSAGFDVYWSLTENMVYFGIHAETDGWVSLGFEPTIAMKDADMVFGWVEGSGDSFVVDAYSTGNYGPHPPDTELGGNIDITDYSGSQAGGVTEFEFSRALATGDAYDHEIIPGTDMNVIWGIGPSDDFEAKHPRRGSTVLSMEIVETFILFSALPAILFAGATSRD